MQARRWGNEYRTTTICIDEYENRVPVGRFYNLYCPDGVPFCGTIDLIRKVESMLDEMKFPQHFSQLRSFADKPDIVAPGAAGEASHSGKLATFAVRVLFRQNASWQGGITWCEGRREEPFRSVLELLFLVDSAVGAGSPV